MRLRFAVLASVLTSVVAVMVPGIVNAAPKQARSVTINATPNPILAGGGVLIYGQLSGPKVGGQTIRLYHRINPARHFSLVGMTKTNSFGFYDFTREEKVVFTNRSWFVKGPGGARSSTIRERVQALVSVKASPTTAETNQPIVFSGHVTPSHAFERVVLQQKRGKSDEWKTLRSGLLGPGSNYSITHRWQVPGERDLRVVFRGDARNIRSVSDSVSVTIQQAQVPGFTIQSSAPVIPEGSSATISGVLDKPGSTMPEPNTSVTLSGRTADHPHFAKIGTTKTGTNGGYKFTVQPSQNETYQVRTTFAPHRHSAVLFEGVRDLVTLVPSSMNSQIGGKVTFTGTVTPGKAGHLIYLQRLGADGDWHNVEVALVRSGSMYRFAWTFGEGGPHEFRSWIPSDEHNVGAVSPAVTITVVGVAVSPGH